MTATLLRRATFAALTLSTLTTYALPAQAALTVYDSKSFTNLIPVQTAVPENGTLFSANFTASGYSVNRVRFSGALEQINGTTGDYASENRIQIIRPDGFTSTVTLSSTSGYTGILNFNTTLANPTPYAVTAPQTWQFRYFNTVDDTPTAGVADARLNSLLVELAFDDAPPPPPPVTVADLGTLSDNAGAGFNGIDSTINLTFAAGQIQFLKFTLAEGTFASRFLDIDTNGSTVSNTDTEIGLYDITGALIGTDDDDAAGNLSQLSFGGASTPRPAIGTGVAGDGRDGLLSAGTYYLAVGSFNSTFGATGFAATSASTATGIISVNLRTNVAGAVTVPEGGAGLLLLLGAAPLGLLARRRK